MKTKWSNTNNHITLFICKTVQHMCKGLYQHVLWPLKFLYLVFEYSILSPMEILIILYDGIFPG